MVSGSPEAGLLTGSRLETLYYTPSPAQAGGGDSPDKGAELLSSRYLAGCLQWSPLLRMYKGAPPWPGAPDVPSQRMLPCLPGAAGRLR